MEKEVCIKCGRDIYGRSGNFKCYLCGDFKKNYTTGKLEPVQPKRKEDEEVPSYYQGA